MLRLRFSHGSYKSHKSSDKSNFLLLLIKVSLSFSGQDINLSTLLIFEFFVQKFLESMSCSFMGNVGQGGFNKELL